MEGGEGRGGREGRKEGGREGEKREGGREGGKEGSKQLWEGGREGKERSEGGEDQATLIQSIRSRDSWLFIIYETTQNKRSLHSLMIRIREILSRNKTRKGHLLVFECQPLPWGRIVGEENEVYSYGLLPFLGIDVVFPETGHGRVLVLKSVLKSEAGSHELVRELRGFCVEVPTRHDHVLTSSGLDELEALKQLRVSAQWICLLMKKGGKEGRGREGGREWREGREGGKEGSKEGRKEWDSYFITELRP